MTGLFEGVQADFVKVMVKFPLTNQNQFACTIETIRNDRYFFIREK
jgi:hypothetical protein